MDEPDTSISFPDVWKLLATFLKALAYQWKVEVKE